MRDVHLRDPSPRWRRWCDRPAQDLRQTDRAPCRGSGSGFCCRRNRDRARGRARCIRGDRALRPVRRLTAAAENVAATGDLTERVEVGGSDELGRLGDAVQRDAGSARGIGRPAAPARRRRLARAANAAHLDPHEHRPSARGTAARGGGAPCARRRGDRAGGAHDARRPTSSSSRGARSASSGSRTSTSTTSSRSAVERARSRAPGGDLRHVAVADDRARRPGAARAGRPQPARQRGQVQPGRRADRSDRARRRGRRRRPRPRCRGGGRRADLRPLLPLCRGPLEARRGPRARDRPRSSASPRRRRTVEPPAGRASLTLPAAA